MNKITSILRLTNKFNKLNTNQIILKRFCSNELVKPNLQKSQENTLISLKNDLEDINWQKEIEKFKKEDEVSIFEPPKEDLSDIAPYTKPSFNFAAYVNKSETLQQLVKLGVDLHKIEKKKDAPELIMKLRFEEDVKQYVIFLNDWGIEDIGKFLTKNPYIFKHNIEDLQTRINYLEYKKFDKEMITRILNKNPYWLTFSTKRIDKRLGHFQKNFELTGEETRLVATRAPQLITYNMDHIKQNTFSIKEEMGFDKKQIKKLILDLPKLWMMGRDSILSRFDYLHNTMKISHEEILLFPNILKCRKSKLKQRHQFLLKLNRAQYDRKKENYVSLKQLIEGTDSDFCKNIAKSSVDIYNTFLKSL